MHYKIIILCNTDQLNTTIHGTMKTTPYELVFGQAPRQSVFSGSKVGSNIMEEDMEDLLEDLPTQEAEGLSTQEEAKGPSSQEEAAYPGG